MHMLCLFRDSFFFISAGLSERTARYTNYNKHYLNESTRTITHPRTFIITHPAINVQIYTISI